MRYAEAAISAFRFAQDLFTGCRGVLEKRKTKTGWFCAFNTRAGRLGSEQGHPDGNKIFTVVRSIPSEKQLSV